MHGRAPTGARPHERSTVLMRRVTMAYHRNRFGWSEWGGGAVLAALAIAGCAHLAGSDDRRVIPPSPQTALSCNDSGVSARPALRRPPRHRRHRHLGRRLGQPAQPSAERPTEGTGRLPRLRPVGVELVRRAQLAGGDALGPERLAAGLPRPHRLLCHRGARRPRRLGDLQGEARGLPVRLRDQNAVERDAPALEREAAVRPDHRSGARLSEHHFGQRAVRAPPGVRLGDPQDLLRHPRRDRGSGVGSP